MATTRVVVPKVISGKKVTVKNSRGNQRQMFLAPPQFSYSSAADIAEVERNGQKALTRHAGPRLAELEFSQTVASMDWQSSVSADVKWLRDTAAWGYKVRFYGLSGLETGVWWHVVDLNINVTQRTPSNEISRATLEWKLKEAVDVSVSAGKTVKAKPKPSKKKKAKPKKAVTRTHKVKKGDTLGKIAQKYLGRASRYPEIYKLNKKRIKNPNRLSVGWVLKIPKR